MSYWQNGYQPETHTLYEQEPGPIAGYDDPQPTQLRVADKFDRDDSLRVAVCGPLAEVAIYLTPEQVCELIDQMDVALYERGITR